MDIDTIYSAEEEDPLRNYGHLMKRWSGHLMFKDPVRPAVKNETDLHRFCCRFKSDSLQVNWLHHAGAYTENAFDTQPKADRWYENIPNDKRQRLNTSEKLCLQISGQDAATALK